MQAARRREEKHEVESYAMPLLQHLAELRTRLVRILAALLIGFVALAAFGARILDVLKFQAKRYFPEGASFVSLSPQEVFITELKAAFFVSLLLSAPYCFYQAWRFVAPGLYRSERRAVLPLVVSSYGLFLLGGCFAYFTILPFTNSFFIGSASPDILQQWSIAQYLTYSAVTLLSMGAVFQIPLVMGFAARVGAATSAWFRSFRRYMWVVIWFVAAIITPPDVISQSLLAGPMMVLYEIGILWSRVQERRAAARPVEPDEDEEDDLDPEPGAAKG